MPISKGKERKQNWLTMVYGVEGIGKTTLAANAPKPLFLDLELGIPKGLNPDFVLPENQSKIDDFGAFLGCLKEAANSDDHETIVIDSASRLEGLIIKKILTDNQVNDLSDIAWAKGWRALEDIWESLCKDFISLKVNYKKNILLLAHYEVVRFDDPSSESYDRYKPRINNRCRDDVVSFFDNVFFAQYERGLVERKNEKKLRAVDGRNQRILHTTESASFIAKNRFNLEPKFLLGSEIFNHLTF